MKTKTGAEISVEVGHAQLTSKSKEKIKKLEKQTWITVQDAEKLLKNEGKKFKRFGEEHIKADNEIDARQQETLKIIHLRLKEKDAEIQRLNLIAKQRLGYIGEVQAQLIAFEKRDAKLANELDLLKEKVALADQMLYSNTSRSSELLDEVQDDLLRFEGLLRGGLLRGEKR